MGIKQIVPIVCFGAEDSLCQAYSENFVLQVAGFKGFCYCSASSSSEEIYAAVKQIYQALGYGDRVLYYWYPGDHDYPPQMRKTAVA
jgi:hypothetical protein